MADYDIGGREVVGGASAYPDGGTLGHHESVNGWELGSEILIGGLAEPDMIQKMKDAGAYADSETTPTNAYWILSGEGPDGTVYFGLQPFYEIVDVPTVGPRLICTSLSFINSTQEDLEGVHSTIGAYSMPQEYNFAFEGQEGLWFQAYNEITTEQGQRVKKPYLALGGRPKFGGRPYSYNGALRMIEDDPTNYAPIGTMPLRTPSGEFINEETEPDDSEPGGGNGDWDGGSDIIPWPDLPTLGAVNSGFLTVYNPSSLQMHQFGDYLWSDFDSVFQNISKYQSNMLDLIVSLSVVPVSPVIGEPIPLKIGGKSVGISMNPVLGQYMSFDCGTFTLSEYYGSSLDYGPYTKIHIFLPYVGVRELKTDEVMDGSVSVRYNIDLVTGTCVALVRCQRHGLDAVLYQFEGNMGMQIPITSRDFVPMYATLAKTVMGTAGGLSSGGAVGAAGGLANAAINVMTMKPNVERAGSLSTNAGHLGVHTPYLIIERPIQSYPKNANTFYGYPCNQTMTLSSCHGYTEAEADILDIPCTSEELDEIRSLLRDGIIL